MELMYFIYFVFCSKMIEGSVWIHGEDLKDSKLIAEITGQMTILQKTRQLPLNVPECMQIVYVRVDVENAIAIPAINFNEHTNIVTIHYKPLDRSVSDYKVVAKAIADKKCGGGKPNRQTKKHKENGDSWYELLYEGTVNPKRLS